TGAALWILILRAGSLGFSSFGTVMPIAPPRLLPNAVLMVQTHIEPNRRVERAILIEAQPGQFLVKDFPDCFAEISVSNAPIGNRPANPMNELPHRRLSFGRTLLAIKIFRHHHFGRQLRPRFWRLHVLLLENYLAAIVANFRGSIFPFELIERRNS